MIEALLRPHVREIVPYSTARDEFTGVASVYLDANENPYPSELNRYPDPHQKEIKIALAEMRKLAPEQIFLGNGNDEAIDLLVRILAAPGDSVTIMPPTYGMYKVAAVTNAVKVATAALRSDFSLDFDAITATAGAGSKILFVCSPNNPTGNQFPLSDIEKLVDTFPGVVVVDEAYVDFADGPSALRLLPDCDRLVVLQTFSKAWGLAGARLGIAYANPVLIAAMDKTKLPYNVNSLTQRAALARLNARGEVTGEVAKIVSERERLARELCVLPGVDKVFPSNGNFLLVRCSDAARRFLFLQEKGVIVRDRTRELHCERCLRITVGTPEENAELLDLMRSFT